MKLNHHHRYQSKRTRNDRKAKRYDSAKSGGDFHQTGPVRHVYDLIFSGLPMPKVAQPVRNESVMAGHPRNRHHQHVRERARHLFRPGPDRRQFIAEMQAR